MSLGHTFRELFFVKPAVNPQPVKQEFMLVVLELYQALVVFVIRQRCQFFIKHLVAGRDIFNALSFLTMGVKSGGRSVLKMEAFNLILADIHHRKLNWHMVAVTVTLHQFYILGPLFYYFIMPFLVHSVIEVDKHIHI